MNPCMNEYEMSTNYTGNQEWIDFVINSTSRVALRFLLSEDERERERDFL